jgi:hypothetical protein
MADRVKGHWQIKSVPFGTYIVLPVARADLQPAYCPFAWYDTQFAFPGQMVLYYWGCSYESGDAGMGMPREQRPARDGRLLIIWDGTDLSQVVVSPELRVRWQRTEFWHANQPVQ